eukprot:14740685-Alexandrium_andersonii.AAC.1
MQNSSGFQSLNCAGRNGLEIHPRSSGGGAFCAACRADFESDDERGCSGGSENVPRGVHHRSTK